MRRALITVGLLGVVDVYRAREESMAGFDRDKQGVTAILKYCGLTDGHTLHHKVELCKEGTNSVTGGYSCTVP